MGANEARDTSDENVPPECCPWWESRNYSRSMHELFIGVIMAVQIYNHTVLQYILSPLFLSYFGFGICELFLACRLTNDSNWLWGFGKVSGRISHAIGCYIILTFIYGWSDDIFVRDMGTLFFLFLLIVILLSLCGLRRPMETDNNVADSTTGLDTELLLGDSHAEKISEIPWWESVEFGRIMYELILGANLVFIAHYHIKFEIYFLPSLAIFYFLLYEFGKPSSEVRIIGRCMGQVIGVKTACYFGSCLISPVFALVLKGVCVLCYSAIIGNNLEKLGKEKPATQAFSGPVIDDEGGD